MNAHELITKLQSLDPNTEIIIVNHNQDGYIPATRLIPREVVTIRVEPWADSEYQRVDSVEGEHMLKQKNAKVVKAAVVF